MMRLRVMCPSEFRAVGRQSMHFYDKSKGCNRFNRLFSAAQTPRCLAVETQRIDKEVAERTLTTTLSSHEIPMGRKEPTNGTQISNPSSSSATPSENLVPIKKVDVEIKSCDSLGSRVMPEYIPNHNSKLHTMIWNASNRLRNIFIIKKPYIPHVRNAMITFINHIHAKYPDINIIVEQETANELQHEFRIRDYIESEIGEIEVNSQVKPLIRTQSLYTGTHQKIAKKADLIVTLGGDGTILRAASLFSRELVPPILSFSLGTLGFLLPYNFKDHEEAFSQVISSRAKVMNRMRLQCHVYRQEKHYRHNHHPFEPQHWTQRYSDTTRKDLIETPLMTGTVEAAQRYHSQKHSSLSVCHAMNDINIHRGSQPHLTTLDIKVDGNFLTRTIGDGVSISTPTGSTAYSLSAGGSIVHPLVPCILLTPICPRSLSFRPVILPARSRIEILVANQSRSTSAKLNIDGISQGELSAGDELRVMSEGHSLYFSNYMKDAESAKQIGTNKLITTSDINQKGASSRNASTDKLNKHINSQQLNDKGIWCVARTENDWTGGLNELLGFNSSFGGSKSDHK